MCRAHCAVILAIAQLSHEVPHLLYTSKFTRLRAVFRRQHGSCHNKLSVCPSVTLVDCDHTRWNSSIITSRMIGLTFLLSADPKSRIYSKGNTPNFSRNRSGVGKMVDFRHLSHRIYEKVQDRVKVAIDH